MMILVVGLYFLTLMKGKINRSKDLRLLVMKLVKDINGAQTFMNLIKTIQDLNFDMSVPKK